MALTSEIFRVLDNAVRSDLRSLRDWYFGWLSFSTWIVIIGIGFELPEICKDTREAFSDWNIGKTARKWIVVLSVIGWLFVVGGIVGEVILEALISDVDTRLEVFNGTLIANTQLETARVNRLAISNEQDLVRSKAELLERQRQLTAAQAALVSDLATEKRLTASAASQLEVEKRKRLELAVGFLPRTFQDQSGVTADLQRLGPISRGMPVRLEFLHELEPIRTAELINFVLAFLGCDVKWGFFEVDLLAVSSAEVILHRVPGTGVRISVGSQMATSADDRVTFSETFARVLNDGLNRNGIESFFEGREPTLPIGLSIRVGTRPNHAVEDTIKELGTPLPPTRDSTGGSAANNRVPFAPQNKIK